MSVFRYLLLFVLLFSFCTGYTQFDRPEREYTTAVVDPLDSVRPEVFPPSWWTGMEMDTIELVLHARNIKQAKLLQPKEGIQIHNIDRVENENYLFIRISIDKNAQEGEYPFVLSRDSGKDTLGFKILGEKTHRPDALKPSDVLYLIMPDRFANGDVSNDVVQSMNEAELDRKKILSRHGGDIAGIMQNLNYLNELGVSAIWLNPVQENDQFYESYHGYAITDHYNIDPRLGNNALYKQLVDSCHQEGMKVIMDIVLNHCGDQHRMILDLPEKNWIHGFQEFQRSNFRATTQMDPYASSYDQKQFVQGWFDHHMPDLNQKNPRVSRFLVQNAIWWVEYAGIDGYRIDTYPYSYIDFTNEWVEKLLNEYPELFLFGETWVHNIPIQAFYSEKEYLFDKGSNVPALTDFQMHFALTDALLKEPSWKEGISSIYYVLAQDFIYEEAKNHIIFLDNHDLNRFWSVIDQDMDKYKMGLTLLMTTRGIPMLYYGTEILLKGEGGAFGEYGRIDFPGGWKKDAQSKFSVRGRTDQEQEAFQFVKKLIDLRSVSALSTGQLVQFIPDDGLYVYFRIGEDTSFMIAANRSKQKRQLDCAKYREVLKAANKGFDHISDKQLDFDKLEIEPNQTFLIEFEPQ